MVPDSSVNTWDSWFFFNLRKINTNQYYESVSLDMKNYKVYSENVRYYTRKSTQYLLYILEQPSSWSTSSREYVHHGLVPGLDGVSFWPPSLSMDLVAMFNPVSCCLSQWVGFHT
jgi:hypothetical protein